MRSRKFPLKEWRAISIPPNARGVMLLTFDLEECEKFRERKPESVRIKHPDKDGEELDMFSLSLSGAERILELLEVAGVKSTFFVTVSFATRYPEFINLLHAKEHEIGFHAVEHGDNYKLLWFKEPERCLLRLKKGKEFLERVVGTEVIGFRAPQLQAPPVNGLKKAGFIYDSSLHPTYVPGRYNNLFETRHIIEKDEFYEVPISVTPLLRLPISWYWFRNLGLNYVKLCTRWVMKSSGYCNLYFHPWDFYPLTNFEFLPSHYKKNTEKMPEMFEDYLNWCRKRGFIFSTVRSWLQKLK